MRAAAKFPLCLLYPMAVTLVLHPQSMQHLAEMKDKARPLLIFEGGDPQRAGRQLSMLASHAAALRERQVVVLGAKGTDAAIPTAMLPTAEWRAVRRRLGIQENEFSVILLGKDGGEKLRSQQPIAWEKLQETIDAMPMRRIEAKSGHQ